jgi:hypothetical protein
METQILKHINKAKDYPDLYNVIWKMNLDKQVSSKSDNVKIALFVNSCFGFGDTIFGLKMYNYIKEWYNIECTVFTTKPVHFLKNGVSQSNLFMIKLPKSQPGDTNCPDLKYTKIYKIDSNGKAGKQVSLKKTEYDLIFVAPWIGTDFTPDKGIMKRFFPYANKFNTFLFSEYNAPDPELYDFPTGIGSKYYGLLITEESNVKRFSRLSILKNPYIMAYIADTDNSKCFNYFVKLMTKKYHSMYQNLDIVIPGYVLNNESAIRSLIRYIKKKGYYKNVVIINKAEDRGLLNSESTLAFRVDVTPLPYNEFVGLFNHALPDVLGTGDQTIGDLVSCCKKFNIYYQMMDWKVNFAKNLGKALGKNYLGKKSSSCGLEKMSLNMHTNLDVIAKNHNFAIEGRYKMDAVILGALELKNNKDILKFTEIVMGSRQKSTVLSKFKKFLEK